MRHLTKVDHSDIMCCIVAITMSRAVRELGLAYALTLSNLEKYPVLK